MDAARATLDLRPALDLEATLDAESLVDADSASPCLADPCQNGGGCKDVPGGFVCACPAGYQGERCEEDVDECAQANGGCAQTCTNQPGTFLCSCGLRYVLNADEVSCDLVNGLPVATTTSAFVTRPTVPSS